LADKSVIYNLGAVFACFMCLIIQNEIETKNLQPAGTAVETTDSLLSIRGAFSDIYSGSGVEVITEKDQLRLRMYTDSMFRVSRAELSREAQTTLKSVSMRLRVNTPSHIHIEGHTSNEPTDTPQFPNNWYLSSARAIAVAMFLVNETGMDAKRITAQGYGSSLPLYVSDSKKNGRIEIIVNP